MSNGVPPGKCRDQETSWDGQVCRFSGHHSRKKGQIQRGGAGWGRDIGERDIPKKDMWGNNGGGKARAGG